MGNDTRLAAHPSAYLGGKLSCIPREGSAGVGPTETVKEKEMNHKNKSETDNMRKI